MARAVRLVASATVGSLIALGAPLLASAQTEPTPSSTVPPATVRISPTAGAIVGTVKDEHGQPITNVVVSALGATATIAVTDKSGRFEFGPLTPGPYLLRAHLAGFASSRGLTVKVSASAQATSAITMAPAESAAPVLAAGLGGLSAPDGPDASPARPDDSETAIVPTDDHSETTWRIRHARRSVLKDLTIPTELLADNDRPSDGSFVPVEFLGKALESPAHLATSFFSAS